MTTTTYGKLKEELKKELFRELSGFIVRESKDPEGEYRPEFVKKILYVTTAKSRKLRFNKKNFLKLIS